MKTLIHAPLFKFAFCFVIGILCADVGGASLALIGIPAFILFVWMVYGKSRKKRFSIGRELLLAVLVYLAGFGLGAARYTLSAPAQWEERLLDVNCERVYLAGHLISPIKTNEWGRKAWMQVHAVRSDSIWHRRHARVQVYLRPNMDMPLANHDSLIVLADVVNIQSPYPGYLDYLHRNGIYYAAYTKAITVGGPRKGLNYYSERWQGQLSEQLGKLISDKKIAGIAQAMFLGEKSGLNTEIRENFATAGLSHILAISGLHIGIIFMVLNWLCKPLHLLKHGMRIKHLLVLCLLIVYMLLTGSGPAVVRAVLMCGAVLIFRISYQRYHLLNLVAIAAVGQLFYDPQMLFQPGFQLSYAAVVGIVAGLPVFEKWVFCESKWFNKLCSGLGVTLIATLATSPFVWIYFGQFSTYFLLSNLIASLISFAVVFSGFLTVLFCWMPGLNEVLAYFSENLLQLLYHLSDWIADLPHAVILSENPSHVAIGFVLIQIALAIGIMLLPKLKWQGQARLALST